MVTDKEIAEQLIARISVEQLDQEVPILGRFSVDGITMLSPRDRIAELELYLEGFPNEWAETEIKAEQIWRAYKAKEQPE